MIARSACQRTARQLAQRARPRCQQRSSHVSLTHRATQHRWCASPRQFSSAADVVERDTGSDEPLSAESPTTTPEPSILDSLGAALKPREVVDQLDKYIIGQADAKRAVAIALRNRWRRHRLPEDIKNEVIPKNILMIGPTGCGKTEIARRIAKLSQAPFLKVEATKFTEVGFHGRDVDQIIRDLVDVSINMVKKAKMDKYRADAEKIVKERLLNSLMGTADVANDKARASRESFSKLMDKGELESCVVDVDLPADRGNAGQGMAVLGHTPDTHVMSAIADMFKKSSTGSRRSESKKLKISDARPLMVEAEIEKMMDMNDVVKEAIKAVEESGIVFIDEIDKICNSSDYRGADASAEGVQRDLLPLIEGSTISTKHGNVNTDFILFIGSGAFSSCKPSDLLAELQGRLPIRVELKGLTEQDMYRILTEPVCNLIRQQKELLAAEGVALEFDDAAIKEMARVATLVNRTVENIGARRLHTVIERIVDEISFDAPDAGEGTVITVTADLVNQRVSEMLVDSDLSRYIL